jgi:hypothetical protein
MLGTVGDRPGARARFLGDLLPATRLGELLRLPLVIA